MRKTSRERQTSHDISDSGLRALSLANPVFSTILAKAESCGWWLWSADKMMKERGSRRRHVTGHTRAPRHSRVILAARAGNSWLYPSGQFDDRDGEVHENLLDILEELGADATGWAMLDWLVSPNGLLDDCKPGDLLPDRRKLKPLLRAVRLHFYGDKHC